MKNNALATIDELIHHWECLERELDYIGVYDKVENSFDLVKKAADRLKESIESAVEYIEKRENEQ